MFYNNILMKILSLRKYFSFKRTSIGPGTPFNADHFLLLLLSQKEGLTTREEDDYIRKEIARNAEAATVFRDLQCTFPQESFELPRPRSRMNWAIAATVVLLLTAGAIYSLSRYWRIVPIAERKVHQVENISIREVAAIIEEAYSVKVYFDDKQVADRRFWGRIDTRKPIEEFLGDLHLSNGVEYAFDDDGNVHFK
jgi:hypothetical protein